MVQNRTGILRFVAVMVVALMLVSGIATAIQRDAFASPLGGSAKSVTAKFHGDGHGGGGWSDDDHDGDNGGGKNWDDDSGKGDDDHDGGNHNGWNDPQPDHGRDDKVITTRPRPQLWSPPSSPLRS